MASELELAGLLSQVDDDAGDEEIFAAQWQHESDNEPLAAAVYLMSNADPARIAGGAAKVKALRSAAKKYSTELSATPPDQSKLTPLRKQRALREHRRAYLSSSARRGSAGSSRMSKKVTS